MDKIYLSIYSIYQGPRPGAEQGAEDPAYIQVRRPV